MPVRSSVAKSINRLLRPAGLRLIADRPMRDAARLLLLKAHEAKVATVIDIGAHVGEFGQVLRRGGFAGRIVSFEPWSEAHVKLVQTAAGDANWTVVPPMALGSTSGRSTLNVAKNGVSSSLLPVGRESVEAEPGSASVGEEEVAVATLDAAFRPDWRLPVALKIDTQGFELEILRGAAAALRHTAAIMIEASLVPLYENSAGFAEVFAFLEAAGFRCIAVTEGFADARRNEVLQVDAIFVSNEALPH